jgi:hypothetical protein
MTTPEDHTPDSHPLEIGAHIQAWRNDMLLYHGTVEDSVPHLGVVWIRETGNGARKMLLLDDYRIHRS